MQRLYDTLLDEAVDQLIEGESIDLALLVKVSEGGFDTDAFLEDAWATAENFGLADD